MNVNLQELIKKKKEFNLLVLSLEFDKAADLLKDNKELANMFFSYELETTTPDTKSGSMTLPSLLIEMVFRDHDGMSNFDFIFEEERQHLNSINRLIKIWVEEGGNFNKSFNVLDSGRINDININNYTGVNDFHHKYNKGSSVYSSSSDGTLTDYILNTLVEEQNSYRSMDYFSKIEPLLSIYLDNGWVPADIKDQNIFSLSIIGMKSSFLKKLITVFNVEKINWLDDKLETPLHNLLPYYPGMKYSKDSEKYKYFKEIISMIDPDLIKFKNAINQNPLEKAIDNDKLIYVNFLIKYYIENNIELNLTKERMNKVIDFQKNDRYKNYNVKFDEMCINAIEKELINTSLIDTTSFNPNSSGSKRRI